MCETLKDLQVLMELISALIVALEEAQRLANWPRDGGPRRLFQ